MLTWLFSGDLLNQNNISIGSGKNGGTVRHKFSKPNVITSEVHEEGVSEDSIDKPDDHDKAETRTNFSRPFQYLGDVDPTKPQPWPKEEVDWWQLHKTLVHRVKESDGMTAKHVDDEHVPQLVFYGDSITEAWNGTSFGNTPGPTRMWGPDEPDKIREVFEKHFGSTSTWGKRALLPPLILGISGSRTYDFIWRIEDGEFPRSQLISKSTDSDQGSFEVKNFERIYIVLMGTNNLGAGMLPDGTIAGMDATGRKILELHQESSPNNPAAIIFSELLPRKDDHRAMKMCPPRCKNLTTLEPFTSFMPAIDKVNQELPTIIYDWLKDFPNSRIVLLSSQHDEDDKNKTMSKSKSGLEIIRCGIDMFAFDNDTEFDAHMPDRLHPNALGYDVWARCIKRGLEEIMDHTISLL